MSRITKIDWVNSIIGTIILSVISSFLYDLIKEKPILTTIIVLLESFWNFILQLLETELKVWWILVIIIFLKILQVSIREYYKSKVPILSDNLKTYNKQSFTNWTWKWEWKWDKNKKRWIINNLWPYCKDCDIKLLDKSSLIQSLVVCPKCTKRFENVDIDDSDAVKAVIYDNVENNRI